MCWRDFFIDHDLELLHTRDVDDAWLYVDEVLLKVSLAPTHELKIALNACSCKSFYLGRGSVRVTRE
jgi:hypothetical protein